MREQATTRTTSREFKQRWPTASSETRPAKRLAAMTDVFSSDEQRLNNRPGSTTIIAVIQ
ncbi:hypothetical protein CASFOL_001814 [Castilleja foliolosa]|uniref:Uncharacterized protein n=1 Tax=Castilleja foliolosa TaxID=1961234 RepID=A0ABD3ECH3_9LAMI